jgi:hypothetical protein
MRTALPSCGLLIVLFHLLFASARANGLELLQLRQVPVIASVPLSEVTSVGVAAELAGLANTIEAQRPYIARGLELCRNVTDTTLLITVCHFSRREENGMSLLNQLADRGLQFSQDGGEVHSLAVSLWRRSRHFDLNDRVCLAGEPKCQNLDQVLLLAGYSMDQTRDEILLRGTRFVRTPADVQRLQALASSAAVRNQILERSFPAP